MSDTAFSTGLQHLARLIAAAAVQDGVVGNGKGGVKRRPTADRGTRRRAGESSAGRSRRFAASMPGRASRPSIIAAERGEP